MQQTEQPLLITVNEALRILKVGRSKFYYLVKHEGLPVIRSGRWVRLSLEALQEWIRDNMQSVA